MSADAVTDPLPLTQTESNTARKKRAKAQSAAKDADGQAPSTPAEETTATIDGESNNESTHVKDLQK